MPSKGPEPSSCSSPASPTPSSPTRPSPRRWPTPARLGRARPDRPGRRCGRSWSTGWSTPGAPCSRSTATAREAEDLVAALGDLVDPATVGLLPELGDAAPRAAQPAQRHRRPPAGGAAPARATPAPTPPTARSQVVVAPVRSVLQPQVKGLGDLEPVELVPGQTRRPRRRRTHAWRTRRTPGSTWSRSAASSRSAAASSTSSRRPRSTRCGWSSGATTSRRSAPSRSPTSARSRRSSGCGRRRAASCCSPTRYAAARPSWASAHPQLLELTDKIAAGIAVEGMESLAPVLVDEHGAAGRPDARRHPRAGARPRAGPQPRARPGRHQRGVPGRVSWAAAAGGGTAPDRPRRRVVPRARRRPRAHPRAGASPGGR